MTGDDLLQRVRESDAALGQQATGATYAGEPDPYKKPREIADDELEDALRAAEVWDVVAQLPDGLDTVVGERGTTLSGG